MDQVAALCRAYEEQLSIPWDTAVAGPQRVWLAVYEPRAERRLRARLEEFAIATKKSGRQWRQLDLTRAFADWMNTHEYRDAYFADPDALEIALPDFQESVARQVTETLTDPGADDKTVVSIVGIGALFPMARASKLIEDIAPAIRGRLLVFFPGECDGPNYRLLNARDGWNYLAIAITPVGGEA
jgi:hypothetical protein